MSNLILKIQAFLKNDTVSRAVKTVVEVVAVQSALYTTVVPNPPTLQASAGVAGGAGLLAVVINLLVTWATKTKDKKLNALAAAIEAAAVDIVNAKALQQTTQAVPGMVAVPAVTPSV